MRNDARFAYDPCEDTVHIRCRPDANTISALPIVLAGFPTFKNSSRDLRARPRSVRNNNSITSSDTSVEYTKIYNYTASTTPPRIARNGCATKLRVVNVQLTRSSGLRARAFRARLPRVAHVFFVPPN